MFLAVTTNVFSQSYRLDADNEPLNKVLNRLDLEISFDDRALASYSATVARSFDNSEEALTWLLEGKPFRIEKIGTVYVIIPVDVQPPKEINSALQYTATERYIYKGTVESLTEGAPLEYATVSLLDRNNRHLTTGITTREGQFAIQTPFFPSKVKISYLGYETLLQDIHTMSGELGRFQMREDVVMLDEAVVTAENTRMTINRVQYTVTPQMREGVDNALELLNSIPGAYFDKTSNTVLLNHQANILLLVDGIQQPYAYLNHLSANRIHAVEALYALSGRYVSDDYAGIIHFILKKDYTGYDVNVSDAVTYNLSKNGGYNRLSEHHPSIGIIYTTRKLNFFGMYNYDRENRHIPTTKHLNYNTAEFTTLSAGRNSYESENHTLTGGLNYHIKPRQLIGIQADYSSGNTWSIQNYTFRRTDFAQSREHTFTDFSNNRIKARALTGTLFYQGQVTNRLHLYGDFSYNYYYNDVGNEYRQDEPSYYRHVDLWDEYKNQTALNVEAKYNLSRRLTVEAGYANIRRRYASQSSVGLGFLDYSENRNKAFAYFSWYLSDKAGLRSGIALEHNSQRNRDVENAYLRTLPFLRIDYTLHPKATLAAGYATSQSYPALNHLSPIGIVIDTFLTQLGNPNLISAVRHQAFAELTLWNRLKIMPQFSYTRDGVSEVYDRIEYKLFRTFENIGYREYSLHAAYDQTLAPGLRLKNTVMLYHSEAMFRGIRNALNGWTFHSEADWYCPRAMFGVQLAWYRNMKKNILWQGYQMSDKDYWCVTARKELWDSRLSVMLSYIPPITFGVRYDRIKELNTPLYQEKTVLNLESYNQMLLLKISFRFDRGSKQPAASRSDRRVNEREE